MSWARLSLPDCLHGKKNSGSHVSDVKVRPARSVLPAWDSPQTVKYPVIIRTYGAKKTPTDALGTQHIVRVEIL